MASGTASLPIPRTGAPVQRGRVLRATSLAHFVNDGTTFFVPVIAALLTSQHGFSPVGIAVLFVIFYTSSSFLSLYVGHLGDRSGSAATLIAVGLGFLGLGLLGFYGALNLLGGAAAFAVAVISALTIGFGSSFYHPLGASMLQHTYDATTRGKALGVNGAFGSLGRTLYPFIFALLSLTLFSTSSLLIFVVLGWASALGVWQAIGRTRTREDEPGPVPPTSMRNAITRGIVILAVVAFLRSVATQGIVAWIPTYLSIQRGAGTGAELGLAVTVLFVGGILGQPFFGLLADRVDPRYLLAASSVGASLATWGYLAVSGSLGSAMLFLIGFFTFSAFPILMSLSSGFVGRRSSSLGNAVVFGLGSGGGMAVGPLVVGLIASGGYSQLSVGFDAMIVLGLIAAVAVLAIPKPGGGAGHVPLFG